MIELFLTLQLLITSPPPEPPSPYRGSGRRDLMIDLLVEWVEEV